MTPERWRQVDDLLQAALERLPGEREDFLRQMCAGDPELEAEVLSLVNSRQQAGSFLESPALEVAAQALARGQDHTPSSVIGSYRIVRLLGEGGMGVVYEAVQENPHRSVALKVVRPGLAASSLRRFEHESQALARLQHPGIAQIYEAGTADTGAGPQPFFAMEFIRGTPLREYAEAHYPNPRERLELMVKICEAVDHAHLRGVIHRDLKPGNILVEEGGQPKILDFGVARVTDSEAQVTRQTDVGQLVGTLEYMSPEQVLADPLEVDTRSDVYALGVILYELLAGRRPYQLSGRLHDAVQTIREEDPAPLSSVNRSYRGDIETIAAKALEKDKARRYESAAELAADIRRYLADEPITARPASATYQLRKFARRNKALVAGVAAVFVVLAGGVVASTWQAARATRERNRAVAAQQRADAEAATAKAVNDFLQNDLLAQASVSAQSGPNNRPDPDLTVRAALDRAAARITGKFAAQPLVEASIRLTIASAYNDMGLFPEAQQQLERALELRQKMLGDANNDTIEILSDLAVIYLRHGNYGKAEALQTRVVDARRRLFGPEDPRTLLAMGNLGFLYMSENKFSPAEQLLTKALEAQRRVIGEEHLDTVYTMSNLSLLYRTQGQYMQAEPLIVKVVQARSRLLGGEHPDTLTAMSILAQVYQGEGRYGEAEPLFTKVLDLRRRELGPDHFSTLMSQNYLADLYRAQGKDAQAEALYQKVLDARRRVLGADHPDTTKVLASLGELLLRQRRYAEAEPWLRELLNAREKRNVAAWTKFDSESMLGAALEGQRKFAAAEPLLLSGYRGLVQEQANLPRTSSAIEDAGKRIIRLYEDWGKPALVAEWRQKTDGSPDTPPPR